MTTNSNDDRRCTWKEELQPGDDVTWKTTCDNLFQFTADGPIENNFEYCPYCGGRLLLS